jgi:hypothetical protein
LRKRRTRCAGTDRLVEGEQGFTERLSRLVFRHHHGKPELLERLAHGARVVDGLLQLRNVLVIIVANDKRDAPLRVRGLSERQ